MNSKIDRRSRQRVVAQVPVRVRGAGAAEELSAETRDVSRNGVFLYTKTALEEGSDVELVLMLPPELTAGEKCWVCCHARVLRVERGSGKEFGVAAEVQRMDVLPEISDLR
jgi:c-di-GMP-binding flagellar brake protein YcgR